MKLNNLLLKGMVAIVVTILLAGCVASPKEKGVAIGMSQKDVLEIAGEPSYTSQYSCPEYARNCPEIWRYDGYNVSFSDGVVDAVQ